MAVEVVTCDADLTTAPVWTVFTRHEFDNSVLKAMVQGQTDAGPSSRQAESSTLIMKL